MSTDKANTNAGGHIVMNTFSTIDLAQADCVHAPDGSQVRSLLDLAGGGMACFELQAGRTTRAVTHRAVEELWFVRSGHGELWRKQDDVEDTTQLTPGVCVSIPVGTHFQFRTLQHSPLSIVAVTMPPWPGEHEAQFVDGPWAANEC